MATTKAGGAGSIQTTTAPAGAVALAKRRTDAIVKTAINWPNFLEVVVLSCYLQGLEDGYETARQRAGVDHVG